MSERSDTVALAQMEPQLRAVARRFERARLDPARSYEDMLQEARIGALLGLRGHRDQENSAPSEAYAVICAKRACAREARRAQATGAVAALARDLCAEATAAGAEQIAIARIGRRETLSGGAGFSPTEHKALVLRLAGYRAAEIAAQLGIGARSAQTALSRARKKAQELV